MICLVIVFFFFFVCLFCFVLFVFFFVFYCWFWCCCFLNCVIHWLFHCVLYNWHIERLIYRFYRLVNHTFEIPHVSSRVHCVTRCIAMSRCLSINFKKANHECHLNDETMYSRPLDVVSDEEWEYFVISNVCRCNRVSRSIKIGLVGTRYADSGMFHFTQTFVVTSREGGAFFRVCILCV